MNESKLADLMKCEDIKFTLGKKMYKNKKSVDAVSVSITFE